jgi:hypothetical protein
MTLHPNCMHHGKKCPTMHTDDSNLMTRLCVRFQDGIRTSGTQREERLKGWIPGMFLKASRSRYLVPYTVCCCCGSAVTKTNTYICQTTGKEALVRYSGGSRETLGSGYASGESSRARSAPPRTLRQVRVILGRGMPKFSGRLCGKKQRARPDRRGSCSL